MRMTSSTPTSYPPTSPSTMGSSKNVAFFVARRAWRFAAW